jgi:hypothetical protein
MTMYVRFIASPDTFRNRVACLCSSETVVANQLSIPSPQYPKYTLLVVVTFGIADSELCVIVGTAVN